MGKNSICGYKDYGNKGCRIFKGGIKNWKKNFLKKNILTQRKLLNFENWCNGELSKIGHDKELTLSKNVNNKKCAPNFNWYFSMKKK
jgi:hypothetical protein